MNKADGCFNFKTKVTYLSDFIENLVRKVSAHKQSDFLPEAALFMQNTEGGKCQTRS